jgi:hypothetical protein
MIKTTKTRNFKEEQIRRPKPQAFKEEQAKGLRP